MKKNMVVTFLFFVIIALTTSMMITNRYVLIDSIGNVTSVYYEIKGVTDGRDIKHIIEDMPIYKDKPVRYKEYKPGVSLFVRKTDQVAQEEFDRLVKEDFPAGEVITAKVIQPVDQPLSIIFIYVILTLLLIVSLIGVSRQADKIKKIGRGGKS